ncbi:unnamed protein product, partial [Symbiodinium necroappetens]
MSPLEEKKKKEPTATADKETEASESEEEDSDQTVPDPPPEAANAPPTTATAKAGTPAEGLSRPSTPERGPEKHRPSTPERGPGKHRHRTPERGRRKTTPERYHRDRRPERGPERKPRDRRSQRCLSWRLYARGGRSWRECEHLATQRHADWQRGDASESDCESLLEDLLSGGRGHSPQRRRGPGRPFKEGKGREKVSVKTEQHEDEELPKGKKRAAKKTEEKKKKKKKRKSPSLSPAKPEQFRDPRDPPDPSDDAAKQKLLTAMWETTMTVVLRGRCWKDLVCSPALAARRRMSPKNFVFPAGTQTSSIIYDMLQSLERLRISKKDAAVQLAALQRVLDCYAAAQQKESHKRYLVWMSTTVTALECLLQGVDATRCLQGPPAEELEPYLDLRIPEDTECTDIALCMELLGSTQCFLGSDAFACYRWFENHILHQHPQGIAKVVKVVGFLWMAETLQLEVAQQEPAARGKCHDCDQEFDTAELLGRWSKKQCKKCKSLSLKLWRHLGAWDSFAKFDEKERVQFFRKSNGCAEWATVQSNFTESLTRQRVSETRCETGGSYLPASVLLTQGYTQDVIDACSDTEDNPKLGGKTYRLSVHSEYTTEVERTVREEVLKRIKEIAQNKSKKVPKDWDVQAGQPGQQKKDKEANTERQNKATVSLAKNALPLLSATWCALTAATATGTPEGLDEATRSQVPEFLKKLGDWKQACEKTLAEKENTAEPLQTLPFGKEEWKPTCKAANEVVKGVKVCKAENARGKREARAAAKREADLLNPGCFNSGAAGNGKAVYDDSDTEAAERAEERSVLDCVRNVSQRETARVVMRNEEKAPGHRDCDRYREVYPMLSSIQVAEKGTDKILQLPVLKLDLALQARCRKLRGLADLLAHHMRKEAVEGLDGILYVDEAVPGNVLRPDNNRKGYLAHFSWTALGRGLAQSSSWVTVGFVRHKTIDRVSGGLASYMHALAMFLEDCLTGVPLEDSCNVPYLLRARKVYLLGDEGALKATVGSKGASGMRPCLKCQNAVSKQHRQAVSLVCIDEPDVAKFQPMRQDRLDAIMQHLRTATSSAEYERDCKLLGWYLIPRSLSSSPGSLVNVIDSVYDPMHCLWSNGVVNVEVGLFLERAAAQGLQKTMLERLAALAWKCGANSSAQAVLDQRLLVFGADYKGSATQCALLLPLLTYFAETVFGDCESLAQEI